MSTVAIPLEVAIPAITSVAASIAAVVGWLASRIGRVESTLGLRIRELEIAHDDCMTRWAREVQRGAALAMREPPRSPVDSLPAPDWEERTDVRNMRARLERDALLEAYATHDTTPPRARSPSRPR
jgi:hypothetical protein